MTTRIVGSPLDESLNQRGSALKYLTKTFPDGVNKVLFVIPPDAGSKVFNVQTARRGRYWNFPPYGAGILAEVFRKIPVRKRRTLGNPLALISRTAEIINLNHLILKGALDSPSVECFSYKKHLLDSLLGVRSKPDLICLSIMFSQTHDSLLEVLECISQINFLKDVPIAVGGVHITNSFINPSTRTSLLDDLRGIKFIFTYESEVSFLKFVEAVDEGGEHLSQVYFIDLAIYFDTRSTPAQDTLDVMPAYDLMQISELSNVGTIGSFYCHTPRGTRIATIISNRGCRAQCTFCSVRNFNGVGVRHRSVESIINELGFLKTNYGIGHLMWLDDDIFKDTQRTLVLLDAISRARLGLTFDCSNGVIASSCSDEIISAAEAAGFIGMNLGMESGSVRILKQIKKPGTVSTFVKAASVLRRFPRINSRVFLMIGFPGETYGDILETFRIANEMNLDWYNITILQPLPNTPIFDSMVEQGLIDTTTFDFSTVRYNSGGLGKHQTGLAKIPDIAAIDFLDFFNEKDLNDCPPPTELNTIWAYMNYHLNFKPILGEMLEIKSRQKLDYIQNLCDIVVPENAFARYFSLVLRKKLKLNVTEEEIALTDRMIQGNDFWRSRFKELDLSLAKI